MYIAPGDYTAVSPQHLTFTSAPSQMCITVNISEDGVVEPTESFTVTLSSSDPAVQQSLPSSTSVTINDSTSKYLFRLYVMGHSIIVTHSIAAVHACCE